MFFIDQGQWFLYVPCLKSMGPAYTVSVTPQMEQEVITLFHWGHATKERDEKDQSSTLFLTEVLGDGYKSYLSVSGLQ